ncbi:MAG: wax ester/triacylglycerol synthase family O-acyltransferase [Halieaceae bacterium]|nr:wax ester/triacylglycerol synthase family O-acyltransferase [Halieaceae bacterium]
MRQLTGLDASFLYLETPNAPMHISGLAIYDPSTAPDGAVRFKQIIDNTTRRIKRLPTMSQRLVTVPLGLDHPYWMADGTFDPEFHIRHLALPKPGDWRQLCILVSRIHARPLDRKRPLWELYVIEGLDNIEHLPKGSFAIFTKMHHAAVDGASGTEITAAMHDLAPDAHLDAEPYAVPVENEPTNAELLIRAQVNAVKQPFRFVSVARNTVPGFAQAYARLRKGELHRVASIPRTRFNGKVSPHRVFNAVHFPLDEIKGIKNAVPGATVNDVAITIVGGALRKYLLDKDELPPESLAAMAPINTRDTREKGTGGNVVSAMTVQVRSDIEDPVDRLKAVHAGTAEAKELSNAVGAKTMTDYTQFIPSTLTAQAARLASRWGLLNRLSPVYNCVITNVPGPQIPLYNTGARLVANYGTGPILDGMGLFHAITSYCGDFAISATSCRQIMPDPDFYRQCLLDSFKELKQATDNIIARAEKNARAAKQSSKKAKAGAKTRAKAKSSAGTTSRASSATRRKSTARTATAQRKSA